MLTPEKLSSYEFNKVTEIYNQLNIDISADIIRRIEKLGGKFTEATKYQLKKLAQLNGKEIFNKALVETAKLDNMTITALKELYEDVAFQDMQGYKELYDYRDRTFELGSSQYQILNAGVKTTNKDLKNFTKTIAFSSKELYVNAVDKAYTKVVTGAFDYNTAIKQAYKEVAEQGITLKDKAGRNVNLDVAVRRNVLNGIKTTANEMNRDIEEQLGTDGYEVTVSRNARPTHAKAQGKQYALNKKDANKYNIGLWNDVKNLWDEYNCQHTYFGIILGISEPIYSNKELKEINNKKVMYNGKMTPVYEVQQKMRLIERNIRENKRIIKTLDKSNKDSTEYSQKLKHWRKEYTKITKEAGLDKENERLYV